MTLMSLPLFYPVAKGQSQYELVLKMEKKNSDFSGTRFGQFISSDGEWMAAGVPNYMGGWGGVYIYRSAGVGLWEERQFLMASDLDTTTLGAGSFYGYSVALEGRSLITGAYFDPFSASGGDSLNQCGSAYIHELDTAEGLWKEVQKISPSDRGEDDRYGSAVALSGPYAFIGAPREDDDALGDSSISDAGAVFVYRRGEDGIWKETQKLTAPVREMGKNFGTLIVLKGNEALIAGGAKSMQVSYYRLEDSLWRFVQELLPAAPYRVHALALNAGYALIGDASDHTDGNGGGDSLPAAGSVYVFEKDSTGLWAQVQKLTAPERKAFAGFGGAVDVNAEHLLAGAYCEALEPTKYCPGAAYLFAREADGRWVFRQRLQSEEPRGNQLFGYTSLLTGDSGLLIGSYEDELYSFRGGPQGVEQEQGPDLLWVYPHPFENRFCLKGTENLKGGVGNITLTTLQGRAIKEFQVSEFGTACMEAGELPAGTYLLQVQSRNGSLVHRKLIQRL